MATYEQLLERMLNSVPSSFNKKEGSFIYDSQSPVAIELQNLYIHADYIRKMTFVGTAEGSYLDELVNDLRGMKRISATKAIVTGEFNIDVPIGNRFSGDSLNYVVTEKISDGKFLLECETEGTVGNQYIGMLIPIEYVQGLETATITEISIPAKDEETDEELRKRFFDSITGDATDGNVRQYEKWIAEHGKVGRGKVLPLWNGANTVKVSILNADNGVASETLVDEFQEYLDPESKGLGNGVAPIGSIVTVTTATERTINITVDVYLEDGYETTDDVKDNINNLFKNLAYTSTVVNFYEIAGVISSSASVARITNLKVNSGTEDIILGTEEIPVLGTLNIQVVTA
jgi:uncharacterized phage protein gp47/JayE